MNHIYQGKCPDSLNGLDSRDKNCPACIEMDRKEKELFELCVVLYGALECTLNAYCGSAKQDYIDILDKASMYLEDYIDNQ